MSNAVRYKIDLNKLPQLRDEQTDEFNAFSEMLDSEIDFSDIPPLDEKFWPNTLRKPSYKSA